MKFIYKKNKSGNIVGRKLEVSDIDDLATISTAIRHYHDFFLEKGWNTDEDMLDLYQNIVRVSDILNGNDRSSNCIQTTDVAKM